MNTFRNFSWFTRNKICHTHTHTHTHTCEPDEARVVIDLSSSDPRQFVHRLGMPGEVFALRVSCDGCPTLGGNWLAFFINDDECRDAYVTVGVCGGGGGGGVGLNWMH